MGNLKQRVPITSKPSNFKGETQHYVVELPKSAGVRQYCPKILQVPVKPWTIAFEFSSHDFYRVMVRYLVEQSLFTLLKITLYKIVLISSTIFAFEPLDSKIALCWFYKLKSTTAPVIQGGRLSDNYLTVASASAAATAVTHQAASEVTRKNASVYETQLTKFYRCVFVSIMK